MSDRVIILENTILPQKFLERVDKKTITSFKKIYDFLAQRDKKIFKELVNIERFVYLLCSELEEEQSRNQLLLEKVKR